MAEQDTTMLQRTSNTRTTITRNARSCRFYQPASQTRSVTMATSDIGKSSITLHRLVPWCCCSEVLWGACICRGNFAFGGHRGSGRGWASCMHFIKDKSLNKDQFTIFPANHKREQRVMTNSRVGNRYSIRFRNYLWASDELRHGFQYRWVEDSASNTKKTIQ